MDLLTFITKLVEFLSWPIASVILVFLLRSQIRGLLPLVKKLKAGPLEAEFEREVKELKASTEGQSTALPAPAPTTPERQVLLQLVQVSPRAAVLEAWRGVEASALKAVNRRMPAPSSGVDRGDLQPMNVLRLLHRAELLDVDEVSLFNELRMLRNRAAHDDDFSPTPESALNYADLASKLQAKLEVLASQ